MRCTVVALLAVLAAAAVSLAEQDHPQLITGVPPSVHGISGNFFLNPETGQETMMDQPEFLRAAGILARFNGLR